jgi:hypothetical protein
VAAFALYALLHLMMAIVHEPWFDEAEAWQIARSASLNTLLTEVPHYEGHPPMWHLILMPFAKLGAPYELTLTLISLVFSGAAVWLILRHSPFPKIVRLVLPFTYFFFYQYSVISRVYCLMMLEFVLLSLCYKRRNEKPFRYTAVLFLLCATSAYGIVIAGGVAAVWLWEILWEAKERQNGFKELVRDRRIGALALLLLAAVLVLLQILPRQDTYAIESMAGQDVRSPLLVRLLYTLLILPADVTMTNVFADYSYLSMASLTLLSLLSGCVAGLLIWAALLYLGRKRHALCLLLLPYCMFAVFSASVYMSTHHIGIGLLFFLFWLWVVLEQEEDEVQTAAESPDLALSENLVRSGKLSLHDGMPAAARLLTALALIVSLSWTVSACVLDIRKEYSPGRSMAAFIKEHGLDQYRIMAEWDIKRDDDGELLSENVDMCLDAVEIAPYFDRNIFYNFNLGADDRDYVTHIWTGGEQAKATYELWKAEGQPQVLVMQPELSFLYDADELSMKDFELVYFAPDEKIWKNTAVYSGNYIYVRRDLLEETGFQ